mgnify:CR=1 FL=1
MIRRNESEEDYLEAILMLKEQNGAVRSIDVAHHMDFSKPSVSRGMKLLREKNYITVDGDGWLELTESGLALAQRVYERHRFLTQWLVHLGVSPETAAADACRIEHDISPETFECLKRHVSQNTSE